MIPDEGVAFSSLEPNLYGDALRGCGPLDYGRLICTRPWGHEGPHRPMLHADAIKAERGDSRLHRFSCRIGVKPCAGDECWYGVGRKPLARMVG